MYIYIYIYIWDWHIKKATSKIYLQFLSFVNIMGVQSVQVHPMDDKNLIILHSKYHASWCTGPLHDWGWRYKQYPRIKSWLTTRAFSNVAFDWLAALLTANQKLHLKIVVSYPCFYPRKALVVLTPGLQQPYYRLRYPGIFHLNTRVGYHILWYLFPCSLVPRVSYSCDITVMS